jgi:hypothetical protein
MQKQQKEVQNKVDARAADKSKDSNVVIKYRNTVASHDVQNSHSISPSIHPSIHPFHLSFFLSMPKIYPKGEREEKRNESPSGSGIKVVKKEEGIEKEQAGKMARVFVVVKMWRLELYI